MSWKVYSPSNVGVTGKYALADPVPDLEPGALQPDREPRDHGGERPRPALLHARSATRCRRSTRRRSRRRSRTTSSADVNSGSLPSVSWIIPPLGFDEHPSSSPDNGMCFTSLVLDALTANPNVWSKTALFLMYDENDGWFDHVPPPTAPAGTAGEYLTASPPTIGDPDPGTLGIAGPLGLGVRVPMLVISPFSRGGHIASEVFDHTSQLKLVASGSASKYRTCPPGAGPRSATSPRRCSRAPRTPRCPSCRRRR